MADRTTFWLVPLIGWLERPRCLAVSISKILSPDRSEEESVSIDFATMLSGINNPLATITAIGDLSVCPAPAFQTSSERTDLYE